MREQTIKLYKFSELSDKAKQVAIDWYRAISCDDFLNYASDTVENQIKEDYNMLGLTFDKAYWSIDRDNCFRPSNLRVTDWTKLLNSFDLGTKKYSQSLFLEYLALQKQQTYSHNYGAKYRFELDSRFSEKFKRVSALFSDWVNLLNEKLEDLEHDALKSLNADNDYINSDEYITETIEANEYEFLESGKRY